jgi:hypothetical protein
VKKPSQSAAEAVQAALMPLREVIAALPRLVADAAFTAVQQAPPRSGFSCLTCFIALAQWETVHMAELKAGHLKACEAQGIPQGDPRGAGVEPWEFVRPGLHPGGPEGPPAQFSAVVISGGAGYCPAHVPGNPAAQASGAVSRLVVAPAMPVHTAARLAMAGMPG